LPRWLFWVCIFASPSPSPIELVILRRHGKIHDKVKACLRISLSSIFATDHTFKSLIAVNMMSSYTLFLAAACYIGTAAAGPPANDAVFPSTLSDCGDEYSEFEQAGILQESD
jgi:hypothetical protein